MSRRGVGAARIRLVAVAALLTVPLLLSGCLNIVSAPVESKPTGESVAAGLDRYYSQVLKWVDCDDGAQCTTAIAPLDWENPSAATDIELALARHSATGTKIGSLFVNPGGPGASGYDFIHDDPDYATSAQLQQRFDVIGWDPRGVGRSSAVSCYDGPGLDDFIFGLPKANVGTDAWIDEVTQTSIEFGQACLENSGELLQFVDTQSTVNDLDMLRAIVGDEKLNYLGYSFGTFFGAIYAALFPKNVGRLVLDGAVDPLVGDAESLIIQMAGFDSAFRAYMEFCLDGEACPFNGSVDDALAQARAVLEAVDARGLVNADGRVLDSATLGTAIAGNLYSETYWQDMTDMFIALNADDPSLSFLYADYYNTRSEDGSYDGNGTAVYVAASCADGDFVTDDATTLERVAEIDAAAPILGKFFAYDDFAVLDTACTNWPVPAGDLPTNFEALGAPPILVIGTTNDPATPYANAVSLAQQLSSGVLVSYEGEGHTIYNQGVSCIDDVVGAYFVSGAVPAEDPDC